MQPQPSSARGHGVTQNHDTSGKTVPPDAIPEENRKEAGVKREFPAAGRREGATDPKVKADRPGEDEASRRGLHP